MTTIYEMYLVSNKLNQVLCGTPLTENQTWNRKQNFSLKSVIFQVTDALFHITHFTSHTHTNRRKNKKIQLTEKHWVQTQ